jgi:predicted phage-related endonuclease
MNPFQLNKTEDDGTNLPLPDRLAAVRSEIKVMTAREKEIALELKEAGGERGAFFEAVVSKGTRRSLDTKAVKEHYGDELEPFYRETEVVTVKLNEIDSE